MCRTLEDSYHMLWPPSKGTELILHPVMQCCCAQGAAEATLGSVCHKPCLRTAEVWGVQHSCPVSCPQSRAVCITPGACDRMGRSSVPTPSRGLQLRKHLSCAHETENLSVLILLFEKQITNNTCLEQPLAYEGAFMVTSKPLLLAKPEVRSSLFR